MLRNDLAREGKVRGPGDSPPPSLPLVVYNGRRPWTAPLNLGGGTEGLPKGLAAMQPKFEYVLLEVRRFDRNALALGLQASAPGVNFTLAQFALENASAEDLPTAITAVARQLKAEDERDLAESFGMWIEGVAHGRAEGLERERALLLRQAQRRFGADVAVALSKLIKGVEDPDRLAEVGDWIVDCAAGGELLKRAGDA